jgi:hypothetical protein
MKIYIVIYVQPDFSDIKAVFRQKERAMRFVEKNTMIGQLGYYKLEEHVVF